MRWGLALAGVQGAAQVQMHPASSLAWAMQQACELVGRKANGEESGAGEERRRRTFELAGRELSMTSATVR